MKGHLRITKVGQHVFGQTEGVASFGPGNFVVIGIVFQNFENQSHDGSPFLLEACDGHLGSWRSMVECSGDDQDCHEKGTSAAYSRHPETYNLRVLLADGRP